VAGNRIIVGSGKNAVTVDGALAGGILRDLEEAIGRDVVAEVERISEGYRAEAEATWPIRTGRSKEALDTTIRLPEPDVVEGVVSTVEYGRFIVSAKVGKTFKVRPRSPLTELRKRVMAGKRADAEHIKAALVAGLNGRLRG